MRRAAIAMTVVLVAACSGGGAPPSPSPSPSAVQAEIAEADALQYSSRYGDAQRAYEAVVRSHPADARAHAALALFDNYRQQAPGAQREAQSAVDLAPRDGRAQAILCRVQDWANHVDDALPACRLGAQLAPDEPLVHLFLGEALADHGDETAAQQELARAGTLIGPRSSTYVRAELLREQANLSHDIGDNASRIASLQAASALQPRWMQRTTELADAYQDAENHAAAEAALRGALAQAPPDLGALEELGDAAVGGASYVVAKPIWGRAQAVAPRDPAVLAMSAHVAVVADRDLDRAEHLLTESLSIDPANRFAAGYLLAIDRYLRGDEARARSLLATAAHAAGASAPFDPDASQAARAQAALTHVNEVRARVGMAPVSLDPRLTRAADAHDYYWLFNNASPTVLKLGMHRETPGFPGFRGAGPGDRAFRAGYPPGPVGEDITHMEEPVAAVDDWVDTVYHRFPILRKDLVTIGYADAQIGHLPMNDMEFGFGPASATSPILYPADGQTRVPPSFMDNELPDPLPPNVPRVSGYPVTVTFPPPAMVRPVSFTLTGPGGAALDAYLLVPGADDENSSSLLTKLPLARATRYVAHIVAIVDGGQYDHTWSFSTS